MPEFTKVVEEGLKLRILCYGEAKLKKTWWAGRAAEAGFNVIMVDGDDGIHILTHVDKAAQAKVKIVNAVDRLDRPIMSILLTYILRGRGFLWDETLAKVAASVSTAKPTSDHMWFNATELTRNDVLVIDSWTALVWSFTFKFAKENSIDLSDASKTEWDGYMWSGNLANWVLSQLNALPCHVIVIAHAQYAEKYEGKGASRKVVSARTQPMSVSKNHGKLLAKTFSDILYFTIVGRNITIDTNSVGDRDGGSRIVAPGKYPWGDLQFVDICKLAGISLPDKACTCNAIKFFPAGSVIPEDLLGIPRTKTPLKASAAKTSSSLLKPVAGKGKLSIGKKP